MSNNAWDLKRRLTKTGSACGNEDSTVRCFVVLCFTLTMLNTMAIVMLCWLLQNVQNQLKRTYSDLLALHAS